MKKLVLTIIMSLVFVMGCNIDVSLTDKSEVVVPEYKIMVELNDGRLIVPNQIRVGSAPKWLYDLQEDRDYHFIIEDFGGSAWDMLSIVNRIEEIQSKGFKITTETYGYNMSGGTFLFLLGDVRIIHSGAGLMLHGAGLQSFGARISLKNPAGLDEAQVKSFQILDGMFIELLKRQTLLGEEGIQKWMYELDFNFMTSKEAMALGVATKLVK